MTINVLVRTFDNYTKCKLPCEANFIEIIRKPEKLLRELDKNTTRASTIIRVCTIRMQISNILFDRNPLFHSVKRKNIELVEIKPCNREFPIFSNRKHFRFTVVFIARLPAVYLTIVS